MTFEELKRDFEISRTAAQMFERASRDWMERALKAEAALAAQQDGADFVRLPIEAVRNSGCPSDTRMRVGECTDAGTCGCSLMLRERLKQ